MILTLKICIRIVLMRVRLPERTIMYSGSRGILYTAPPNAEENSEKSTTEATTADADDEITATAPTEGSDGLAADD